MPRGRVRGRPVHRVFPENGHRPPPPEGRVAPILPILPFAAIPKAPLKGMQLAGFDMSAGLGRRSGVVLVVESAQEGLTK